MKSEQGTVTVRDLTGPDGKKLPEITKSYMKVIFVTSDDLLTAMQSDESLKEVLGLVNYAKDLKLRAAVRAQILSENEGPGKAIDRLVKDIIKMRAGLGKPITEEAARKLALTMQDESAD